MLARLLTLWVTRHESALKRQLRIPADVVHKFKMTFSMRIISIIGLFILLACNPDNSDFYYCANKAGLFSRDETFPLRFDTIKDLKSFKVLASTIRDTLQLMTPFGYIYNYADSSFIPNANPKYNLIIEGLIIIPKGSNINVSGPYLKVFISSDSVEIIDYFKNRHVKYIKTDTRIRSAFYDYFNSAYCLEENKWKGKFIHIILPDSLNFDEYLLPYLRIALSSYKANVEKYLVKSEINICDSSRLNNSEMLLSLS
jgi:hypothetical protein